MGRGDQRSRHTQCQYRVHPHCASRWEIAGRNGNGRQQQRDRRERQRIARRHAEQQTRTRAPEPPGSHEPERHTDQAQRQPLTDNHPEDVAGLGADGHPQADFLSARHDRVLDEPVDPDGGHQ